MLVQDMMLTLLSYDASIPMASGFFANHILLLKKASLDMDSLLVGGFN